MVSEIIYKLIPLKQALESKNSNRLMENHLILIIQGMLRISKFGSFVFYDSSMDIKVRIRGDLGMQGSILLLNYRFITVDNSDEGLTIINNSGAASIELGSNTR